MWDVIDMDLGIKYLSGYNVLMYYSRLMITWHVNLIGCWACKVDLSLLNNVCVFNSMGLCCYELLNLSIYS
jgi:hypothetical protein